MEDLSARTIIVVPIVVQDGSSKQARELSKAIYNLTEVGEVLVVNQGEKLEFDDRRISTRYTPKPLGIWGAVHSVYDELMRIASSSTKCIIVHNLAPLYFDPHAVRTVVCAFATQGVDHAVGCRADIAAALHADPNVGYSRALAECFLTALAGVVVYGDPAITPDGFTGLQAFSRFRYAAWDWKWLERTTWGGGLEGQLQTLAFNDLGGMYLAHVKIPHLVERTWDSTIGIDFSAVVNTFEGARQLPVFQNVSQDHAVRAIREFGSTFASQPWMNPETAADDILEILREYAEKVKEPFLRGVIT